MDDPELPDRTRLGPPGVDTETFVPRPPDEAAQRLQALADRLEGASGGGGRHRRLGRAARPSTRGAKRIVSYVGKLVVSKGWTCCWRRGPWWRPAPPMRGSWWWASAPTETGSSG